MVNTFFKNIKNSFTWPLSQKVLKVVIKWKGIGKEVRRKYRLFFAKNHTGWFKWGLGILKGKSAFRHKNSLGDFGLVILSQSSVKGLLEESSLQNSDHLLLFCSGLFPAVVRILWSILAKHLYFLGDWVWTKRLFPSPKTIVNTVHSPCFVSLVFQAFQ